MAVCAGGLAVLVVAVAKGLGDAIGAQGGAWAHQKKKKKRAKITRRTHRYKYRVRAGRAHVYAGVQGAGPGRLGLLKTGIPEFGPESKSRDGDMRVRGCR